MENKCPEFSPLMVGEKLCRFREEKVERFMEKFAFQVDFCVLLALYLGHKSLFPS